MKLSEYLKKEEKCICPLCDRIENIKDCKWLYYNIKEAIMICKEHKLKIKYKP